jgi:hypothetical protein
MTSNLETAVQLVADRTETTTAVASVIHNWLMELYPDEQQLTFTDISYLVALAMNEQCAHDEYVRLQPKGL